MDKESLVDLLKHSMKALPPEQQITEIKKRIKDNNEKQRKIIRDLKPDNFLKTLINLAKEFLTLKMIRKGSIFHASYVIDKIRTEASRRLGITLDQCRCMLPEEFIQALELSRIDKKELEARGREMLYFCDNGKEKIYTGQRARKLIQELVVKEKAEEVSQLQGSIASPGKVSGIVKLIKNVKDIGKMNKGDILVAMATNPNFVPAMKKSAAIITDMGGITCHAAIVSRELGIPCIIGTKIATKVLKDGDLVEVDAEKGVIKILKRS